MTVKHEITLVFFQTNEDGTKSICDIIETSRKYAYRFFSRNMRKAYGPENVASHVKALRPGQSWSEGEMRVMPNA